MSHVPDPTTTAAGGKPYTAPARQIWGWGVGRIAEFGLVGMFGQAMNIFSVGFGLNPVIVSWCMMLPRLIDGIIDPIVGHWSDDTHTRWGRRKPFMLGGALLGSFFVAILWWASPQWNQIALFVFLGVVGTLLYICYGAYTMAWNAIGFELSDDYNERAKVQAIGWFFTGLMGLAFSWVYWLALRPVFGGVIWGMRWMGAGLAVVIVLSALTTVFTTRERFTHANRTHVPLFTAIRATLTNRPFVILIIMRLFETCGGRLAGGLMFFLSIYYVCRGDQDLATKIGGIGMTVGTVWSFVVLPLAKPASKWIGKRGALIAGTVFGFLSALLAPIILTPAHPYWGLIPTFLLAPVLTLTGIVAGAILPDICDVDELKTGQRREGLFTSVMAFVTKLEISIMILLVGYVVSWSGVDTKIATRWQEAADGKEIAAGAFSAGESAVFSFADGKAQTFDAIDVKGGVEGIRLYAGDTSPTEEFRLVGVVPGASVPWKFPAITAKFVKIELPSSPSGETIPLQSLRLTPVAGGANLLSANDGGKVAAAQPPPKISKRLYWLVVIMGIVFTGLTMVTAFFFPLDEKQMEQVRRTLDERRLAAAALGEPTDEVAEEFAEEHPGETAEFVVEHPDVVAEVEEEEELLKDKEQDDEKR